MSAILELLGPYVLGAGGILAAIVAAYVKGRLSGAKLERNANKAKEADAYADYLKDLEEAANAGNRVGPSDRLSDDRYNRDR